jgi:hypothetical protein
MKPDLTLLYSELGLRQNCSLAELQLAYRRRISELQSDRAAGSTPSPETLAALRELLGLYTTASRFHRRYGRLPGAAPVRRGHGPAVYSGTMSSSAGYGSQPASDDPSPRPRGSLAMIVTLLVLLFGVLAMVSGEWLR